MVFFYSRTMLKSKATSNPAFQTRIKNAKESATDNKKIFRDACLFFGVIIIIVGCIAVFVFMDEEDWAENSYIRKKILLLAGLLFVGSTGLCLYIMRSERKQLKEELELLVIEKPPSYESVVLSDPPPAYIAVVQSIHVIQQETTG